VPHLDGAVLHGIEDLQARNDLAAREGLDLELVVGGLADLLGEYLDGTPQGVQRFRPTCRQTPFDLRRRLGNGRCGQRSGACGADTGDLEKISSLH
jgi:hypothetical protein